MATVRKYFGVLPSELVGTIVIRKSTSADLNTMALLEGELAYATDTEELRVGTGEGGFKLVGSNATIPSATTVVVAATGTPLENGQALLDGYKAAMALYGSMAIPNGPIKFRVTLLLMPGIYDLGTGVPYGGTDNHGFVLDSDDVAIVGMDQKSTIITSGIITPDRATIEIPRLGANFSRRLDIRNLTITTYAEYASEIYDIHTPSAFRLVPDGDGVVPSLGPSTFTDLIFAVTGDGTALSMQSNTSYDGVWLRCICKTGGGFGSCYDGSLQGGAVGTFIDCEDEIGSAFGYGCPASGTFIRCKVGGALNGDSSFGFASTASGKFYDCIGAKYCFGCGGTASGTFYRCRGKDGSFGGTDPNTETPGTASGKFYECAVEAGTYCFGSGVCSGSFYNCRAPSHAFRGTTATMTCYNCQSGAESFGPNGIYIGCTGTSGCFGRGSLTGFVGVMDRCRAKSGSGTTITVGQGARIYNSTIISTGSNAYSFKAMHIDDAATDVSATIVHCVMTQGFAPAYRSGDSNSYGDVVTVATPYNIIDASITG